MKRLLALFCLLLANIFVPTQPPSKPLAKSADDVYDIQERVLIKTRDGASLSATIVRKKENRDPLPAVLFYTTYDQGERDSVFGKRAVDKGYVGIVAYARGIRTNLADYFPYEHDGNDIYDLVDWISKQPWCNGKVGTYGGSYTGFAQWAAVKHVHPALKTIVRASSCYARLRHADGEQCMRLGTLSALVKQHSEERALTEQHLQRLVSKRQLLPLVGHAGRPA